jgi:hypothetical protein
MFAILIGLPASALTAWLCVGALGAMLLVSGWRMAMAAGHKRGYCCYRRHCRRRLWRLGRLMLAIAPDASSCAACCSG